MIIRHTVQKAVIGRTACLVTGVIGMTAAIGCGEELTGQEGKGGPGSEEVAVVGSALTPDVGIVDTWTSGSPDVIASCPSGRTLIGGGFVNPNGYAMNYSAPAAAIPVSGWQTGIYSTYNFASEALCLPSQTTDAAVGAYDHTMIPAYSTACAYATCPTGSIMSGGGFKTGLGGYTYASYALSSTQWIVCGGNDTGSPVSVGAWGRCLPSSLWPTAKVYNVEAYSFASPGTSATAIAACPARSRVSGNGFRNDPSGQIDMKDSSAYMSWIGVWQMSSHMTIQNNSSSGLFVRAVATCLEL